MLIGNKEYDSIVIKDEFNCVLAIIDDNSILQKDDWSMNNCISIKQEPTNDIMREIIREKLCHHIQQLLEQTEEI